MRTNMSYDVQIVKTAPSVFAQLNLLPNSNLRFTMPLNQPDTPEACEGPHSHAIHVPWTHPTRHSKLHLNRCSCFHRAHVESPYTS